MMRIRYIRRCVTWNIPGLGVVAGMERWRRDVELRAYILDGARAVFVFEPGDLRL